MSRKFLYLITGFAVIVILAVADGIGPGKAEAQQPQLKRPQETTPEEKPPEPSKKKKGKEPRAVGLVQLSSKGKATLIPIAILIDGRFYDASVYKADPVPMALEFGTVYEAEETGESQGLFTVSGALHSKNPSSPSPWLGAGSFVPHGAEVAQRHKAENVPVGIDNNGDEPPKLVRGSGSKQAGTSSPASSSGTGGTGSSDKKASGASSPSGSPSSTGSASGSDPSGSQTGGSAPAAGSGPAAAPQTGSASPGTTSGGGTPKANGQADGDKKGEQGDKGQAPKGAAATQSPAEGDSGSYYRPTLRRGKPTQSAPEEDETSAAVASTAGGVADKDGSSGGSKEAVQLIPAISDAGGPDPRPYKFYWKEGEEDERRKQMLTLAEEELRAYVNARAKGAISAKPAGAKVSAAARKPSAKPKPPQPVLENAQFRAFDVWVNNQPVMVLSADGHMDPAETRTGAPNSYSVTIVARTDIYGNLRKLYSGVTDKFHLDVTPKMELIDAVDADGDGRGELLFRETTDAGSGYVIYRATADKLWKMFDSLGGE